MVIAESGKGHDQPIHSPKLTGSSRPAFGYSPEKPSADYSGSGDRPKFGLPPATHLYPDNAIVEERGSFGLPQRKKEEYDEKNKKLRWHQLGRPKRINGGLSRLQRRRK